MFRRSMLRTIELHSDSFAVNFEFVIKAYRQKYRYKELPTKSRERLSGQSKVFNFKTIQKVFFEIVKMRQSF